MLPSWLIRAARTAAEIWSSRAMNEDCGSRKMCVEYDKQISLDENAVVMMEEKEMG